MLLEFVATIAFPSDFTATHILHPSTYVNKILIASSQGGLQLWNVSTKKLIHSFEPLSLADTPSPITCLVQSPAIDVVAIGFASGEISVYDIRMDERLLRMFQEGGPVRSLSFRGGSMFPSIQNHKLIFPSRWTISSGERIIGWAYNSMGSVSRRSSPPRASRCTRRSYKQN
jgi:U3 small nucleolar RNA-associated protein 21